MQEQLLKKIIANLAGPGSERLVDLLFKKQNVNEFLIAKKLDLTINQTRNMLYKLADEGLVAFIRKKDKKKGGWYTYFWTLRIKKTLEKYDEEIKEKLERLQKQLTIRKTERHYYCENCDLEYTEEDAMLIEYTCTECGEVLKLREAEEITTHIQEEIIKLKEEEEKVEKEIQELEKKEEKALQRKLTLEKKRKEEERLERKRLREKEKAKLLKAQGKKPKKKVTKKKTKKKAKKKKTKTKKKVKKKTSKKKK